MRHGWTLRSPWRAAVIACLMAVAAGASRPTAHTRTTQVSWTVDVAPIVRSRCVKCHQPGGFGPMPLVTYQDARPWAKAIREQVLSGEMPPWSAVAGYGDFSNDGRLSGVEMELIARWADGATPLGPDVAPVPAAAANAGSRARRIELPAVTVTGASVEQFEVPLALEGGRWISAWRVAPGARSLLERVVLTLGGAPIGTWTPLDDRIEYPRGVAQRIPRGSRLGVAIRYRKSVEPRIDQSAVELEFGPPPARELKHRTFACGTHVIDGDIDVLAVTPRPGAAGDTMEVIAYSPRSEVEPLSVVSRFRPEYALTYRLRAPLRLARGTRIAAHASSAPCLATVDYVSR